MADDDHSFHAQQRSAAVLGVIDALLEVLVGGSAQQVTDLAGEGCRKRFLEHVFEDIDHSFTDLEGNIADESVANDDVGMTGVQVATLYVADKVERDELQQLSG